MATFGHWKVNESDTLCKLFNEDWLSFVGLFDQWKIRHNLLENLLWQFVVHLVIEEWFHKTHCVIYSTNIDLVLLHYLTNEKSRHYVLANFLCYFVVHLIIEEWTNQTHCFIWFTNIDSALLHYFTSEKSDTVG